MGLAVIYRILNKESDKYYIGSAVDFKSRRRDHKSALRRGKHCNNYLQNAWNKYGEKCFKFEILLFCDKENLLFYEQRAIDVYESANGNGYNICLMAGSRLGVALTEAHKRKLSEVSKGRKHSEETKEKMSGIYNHCYGQKHTEEFKQYLSRINKGKLLTQEHRMKISNSLKGRTGYHKGKSRSEEVKEKISRTLKGHAVSPETRRKLSETAKRQWSDKRNRIGD